MSTEVIAPKQATDDATMEKLRSLMKIVTPDKVMRAFGRTVNDNIKLDKFLRQEFSVPKAFGTKEEVAAKIQKLFYPEGIDNANAFTGLIDVKNQQLRLAVLTKDFVEVEIAAKTAWLQSFKLDEEQQELGAKALTAYGKVLHAAIVTNVKAWSEVYGTYTPESK